MKIKIPELSLVVLMGPSGSGKSTFARRHFKPTEVLSSDFCRGLVADDENDQTASDDAFAVLHFIARTRLSAGRLTVIDATNVRAESRTPLVALAREFHCLPVAVVLNLPERLCHERNALRADRAFGPHVVRNQVRELRRSLSSLPKEGFRHVFVMSTPEDVEAATVEREPLWNDRRFDHGPFDIIGDIHGCHDELLALLTTLGYRSVPDAVALAHPEGRKAVFLGDLVDRGPKTPQVLRLAMDMVRAGSALCVPGNHDMKLLKKLRGKDVRITHGLKESIEQLEREPPEFLTQVAAFLDELVSHYVLDDGRLVVAHAGLKETLQGRGSGKVREFALYGETTGETDQYGLPVRYDWASEYRGRATVVYGHTPVPEPEWLNRTINIDTGCVFGGRLTALRYPEKELVSVPAIRVHYEPAKPFLPEIANKPPALSAQRRQDELLDIQDVLGKRLVTTRLRRQIAIREENAAAALEAMSRFAIDPRFLVYLPPTMSPTETSRRPDLLEHPEDALAYYRDEGIAKVVIEEKHMGSRAVVVVFRDASEARRRFGVPEETLGIVYTRTGRRFFDDPALESALLERLSTALSRSGIFDTLKTNWVVLDAELMPWSQKARQLLRTQYAAVHAAARAVLPKARELLETSSAKDGEFETVKTRIAQRDDMASRLGDVYRPYCWPVAGIDDLRLAPFHLLASQGAVHVDKDHVWHMETLARLAEAGGPLVIATPFRVVDTTRPEEVMDAISWWESRTAEGGEGVVVKPSDFVASGRHGLLQPAVKCRGREYLRLIYGPEYTAEENLSRLRRRGLASKRSLALREFALGIEALERLVAFEPLRRVHECVFGILALESEPVDPRF